MLKRKHNENLSADAKKQPWLDTAGQSSSVDTANLDTPDTRTLARWDVENQATWETEYSYGGEADLHEKYMKCTKNPGHKNFIPVDQFSIEDLPEGYRDPDTVDFILAASELTVLVTVRFGSHRRPVTVPGSDNCYPGYDKRGHNRITVGTGWVRHVSVHRDQQGGTCQCKACRFSSTPKTDFAVIWIATAKHVVFDKREVEDTTCHLFFDSGAIPESCSGVVTLTGMVPRDYKIEIDQYWMEHYTHDLHLGDRLLKTCTRKDNLMDKLYKTLPRITQYKYSLNEADKQPLIFIVSHPHGSSKHISIGHWTSVSAAGTRGVIYEYTTATCPGSTGAQVLMPHTFAYYEGVKNLHFDPRIHCGKTARPGVSYLKENYNFEMNNWLRDEEYKRLRCDMGSGRLYPILEGLSCQQQHVYKRLRFDMGSGRLYPILEGPWEDIFNFVDEEDLHKNDDTCHGNPSP